MEPYQQIARILRTDQDIIKNLQSRMEKTSGKIGVLDSLVKENRMQIEKSNRVFGFDGHLSLMSVVEALQDKLKSDEEKLKIIFGGIHLTETTGCEKIIEFANKFLNPKEGSFLKKEKAIELLRANPPQNVLKFLGYQGIDEALQKENLFELFASLRFGEEKDWLNNVFFKQYEALTPKDFEKRKIQYFGFSEKFSPLAQEFIQKKYHNLSHLKELGVIFIVPFSEENLGLSLVPGQLMKIFSLAFHYFHEVTFYSELFEQIFLKPDFSQSFVSLLRGDVLEPKIDLSSSTWLVTQRYLEKDDPFEIGLMVPHINPESIHWAKAQNDISKINPEFEFWHGKDWIGDYFKDEVGADDLVSFNLVDVAMSLADKNQGKFYTYHQREALWNKIFAEYLGWEVLEKTAKENIVSGRIEFK